MKLKTTLLTLLICAATFSTVVAQDKYEYMMISQVHGQGMFFKVYIAISSADNYSEDVITPKSYDMNELIKRVTEYTDKGWEVYNTGYSTQGYMMQNALTYFLRKKKS